MRTWLILIAILVSGISLAQDSHPYVKHLRASATGDQLLVSWTTKAGFSCQDIGVQLSTDSQNFETKAVYFGICGDFNEKEYSLIIDSPYYNQINFIRLDLGTFGFSYIISKEVIRVETASAIPHPLTAESRLYFKNSLRAQADIEILDVQGRVIYKTSTTGDQVELSLNTREQLLIYRIYLDGTLRYTGKLLRSN